jgi:hypothetical protein
MGSSLDLYIRCECQDEHVLLKRAHPQLEYDEGAVFARLPLLTDERYYPGDVQAFAAQLEREVIYMGFSSVSDSLQFTHCVPGKILRHLQYGCYVEQGLWEEVEGEPESWEQSAFFDPKDFKSDPTDDPDFVADRRRIFEAQRVVKNETLHMVDARESARAAAVHYRFTGWYDSWRLAAR